MPEKGIFKRIFTKNKKPVNAHRVVISDAQKRSKDTPQKLSSEAIDFTDLYEETGLEETPAADFVTERSKRNQSSGVNGRNVRSEAVPVKANGYRTTRSKNKKRGFISAAGSLFSIFKRETKTSNSSALEFAGSGKRLGKKGRKNRRILIYSGTGVLVAVAVLVVLLVPGGAAPADAGRTAASQTDKREVVFVASQSEGINIPESSGSDGVSESPSSSSAATPQVSKTPEPTIIATTKPDVTQFRMNLDKEAEKFITEDDRYYNEMGYSTNEYKYTDEEFYILAQVIHMEARGETPNGKIAVGNVVMNRVLNRRYFGNNIKSVVTAPKQFAYKADAKPGVASKIAARQVLDYEVWVVPQDVYYFRAVSKFSSLEGQDWKSHKYFKRIGGHYFYRHSYSGRMRGGGVPPALFDRTYKWPTKGCKPEDRVYRLQWMLNKLGYDVKADKYFGEGTKDAIKEFQKKKGLKVDGVAGPSTIKELIKEFGDREYYLKFCA